MIVDIILTHTFRTIMKKKDLQAASSISWASATNLSKAEVVGMEVLTKVGKALQCNIDSIIDLLLEDEGNDE